METSAGYLAHYEGHWNSSYPAKPGTTPLTTHFPMIFMHSTNTWYLRLLRIQTTGLFWEKQPNDHYNLTFHLKWYQNNQTQQTGAILHLDHTISEYDAMTRIHSLQFKSRGILSSKDSLKTLDDLKAEMDLG